MIRDEIAATLIRARGYRTKTAMVRSGEYNYRQWLRAEQAGRVSTNTLIKMLRHNGYVLMVGWHVVGKQQDITTILQELLTREYAIDTGLMRDVSAHSKVSFGTIRSIVGGRLTRIHTSEKILSYFEDHPFRVVKEPKIMG